MSRQYQLHCIADAPDATPTFYGIVGPDDVDYAMMLIASREYLGPNAVHVDTHRLVLDSDSELTTYVEAISDSELSTYVEDKETADGDQVVLELCVASDGARSLTARRMQTRQHYWLGVWPYEEREESTPFKVTAELLWRFGALPDWSDKELELADGLESLFSQLRNTEEEEE